MKAADVMTRHVVVIKPDNTVSELVDILLTHGISAVPVVENGKLVGIVGEGDLIRRAEIGTAERPRPWWLRLFADDATLASEYVKSHAKRVRDVMTRTVVTVTEETPLGEIATLLEKNRIKRVPVLRDGRPVGIVSRADLIQALAAPAAAPDSCALDDGAILTEVLKVLRSQPWASVFPDNVTVTDGLVEFWGVLGSEAAREATRVAAETVPGVRAVKDHRVPPAMSPPYV